MINELGQVVIQKHAPLLHSMAYVRYQCILQDHLSRMDQSTCLGPRPVIGIHRGEVPVEFAKAASDTLREYLFRSVRSQRSRVNQQAAQAWELRDSYMSGDVPILHRSGVPGCV
jgi:hypothetical protein